MSERRATRERWTDVGRRHLEALAGPLDDLGRELVRIERWGRHLAAVLDAGGRLLAVGNGGSAAQADHLAAELAGRFQRDRRALSGIALGVDGSTLTALVNDYGPDAMFARQVEAHGRAGDVLVGLSTSGRSPDLLAAVETAHRMGVTVWVLTGPAPNPLLAAADDGIAVDAPSTATVQEIHQVAIHLLCDALDHALVDAQ